MIQSYWCNTHRSQSYVNLPYTPNPANQQNLIKSILSSTIFPALWTQQVSSLFSHWYACLAFQMRSLLLKICLLSASLLRWLLQHPGMITMTNKMWEHCNCRTMANVGRHETTENPIDIACLMILHEKGPFWACLAPPARTATCKIVNVRLELEIHRMHPIRIPAGSVDFVGMGPWRTIAGMSPKALVLEGMVKAMFCAIALHSIMYLTTRCSCAEIVWMSVWVATRSQRICY